MLRTIFSRWLTLVASAALSACGGTAGGSGGTTPAVDPDPDTCTVAIRVEEVETATGDDDMPHMNLTMVRICERGGTLTLGLPTELGVCQPEAPEGGALAVAGCWWAGAGSQVVVRRDGDSLVAWRSEFDEETAPSPPTEVGRLPLPPDTDTVSLRP